MMRNGLNGESDSTVEYDGWHIYKKNKTLVEVVPYDEGRIELTAKVKFCERFAKQDYSNIQFKIFSNRDLEDLDGILSQQNYIKSNLQFLMIKRNMCLEIARKENTRIKFIESSDVAFLAYRNALGFHEISVGDKECICEILVDGRRVGSAFSTINKGKMGIFNVVVEESYRGYGYGEHLLRALFHWGREQGAQNAFLNVSNRNKAAISLYRKIGFIIEAKLWTREKTIL